MLRKIGRLFTIKTRFEAWLVIYAIALGAVERGQHYLATISWLGLDAWRWRAPAWSSWPAGNCSIRSQAAGTGDCCGTA